MNDDKISGALQENILTLLCHDDASALMIRAAVTPHLFESAVFREVAGHAIDFIDQFGESIKDHLPDSLELIMKGEDTRKANAFTKLLDNMYLAKEGMNAPYVISQLNKFVRQQTLKSAVIKAVEAIEAGRIDDAEVAIQKGLNTQLASFTLGTQISNPTESLKFLDIIESPILTGIDELDKRGVGPMRGELLTFMAPSGMGKTWALMHFGKWALLQRMTVVHITLEMSEARCSQRYLQSFFAVSKREAEVMIPGFRKGRDGAMEDMFYDKVHRLTLEDPDIRTKLQSKITREFRRRAPLIIKQFPTGSLTMSQLTAYLDGLERYHKIIPDMLVLDYPDLMAVDAKNLRTDLGELMKNIRGLCVERNMAGVVASQTNRESTNAKLVRASHASEDFSKVAISDTVLTYTQTLQEKKMGLARLFVDKSRNEEGKFIALITQSYGIGQFALDSAFMPEEDYWSYLGRGSNDTGED